MHKRRDNIIEFVYYNVQNIRNQILPLLGIAISLFGEANKFTPYIRIGFYLLMAFIVVYSFLKWYNKVFEFNEQMIRISEGIFSRKRNDIPYNRVKSINTSDSLLKRLFGIANFSVELIGGSKVVFVLKQKEIDELKSQLFTDMDDKVEELKIEKLKPIEYLLLSLTNLKVFLMSFSLTSTLFSFLLKHLNNEEQKEQNDKGVIETFKSTKDVFTVDDIWTLLSTFLILIVVSYVISYIYIFLTFGNFLITSNRDGIHIQYGILNKKKYHIPKKQIRSLQIVEPIIFRFFGFVQLKIDNIGLNEQGSSSIILHPIIKKELIAQILSTHIPDFQEQEIEHKPTGTLKFFLLESTYLLVLSSLILSFASPKFLFLLLLIPLSIAKGYIKQKYSGLTFNEKYATIRKTNGLRVTTMITLKKYVETTNTAQSLFMKKKNLHHYELAVYSEKLTETYKAKFLNSPDKAIFHKYLEL